MKPIALLLKRHALLSSIGFLLIAVSPLRAQISLVSGTYSQDFNSLANTGTSNLLPTGWLLSETLANANATYTAGTGSGNAGDTYSFGSTSAVDRSFGGLQSGTLIPTIGAGFTNNAGNTITSITITYTGEQWRLGALARPDQLLFQYSTNATSLTTGTWISVSALDFTAPTTSGVVGLLDGNVAANRVTLTNTIGSLTIANGATFYIRWNDLNASGADDGLGVDDFSLSFTAPAPAVTITCPSNITVSNTPGTCGAVVTFPNATVTGGGSAVQTCGPVSGSTFPTGTTTVCFQVNGDPSINCSFTVTVNDIEPPVAICQSITVNLNGSGTASITPGQVNNNSTDNCGTATPVSVVPSTFTCANVGPNSVTLTVADAAGNTSTCIATVTVADITPPVANCQNATVFLDPTGNATLNAAQINNGSTDNCGVASIAVFPNSFNCSNISTSPAPTDLFISEYIEGSSNNKCIEIYNGTASSINLAAGGYTLRFYFNGAVAAGLTIPLSGTVAAGDVYVVCQSTAAPAFLAQADQTNASGWYNGDDAVELIKSGSIVLDVVGSIGTDPGTEWGTGLVSTADNTIRRKPNVTAGVTSNPPAFPGLALEWNGFATDEASGLGSHSTSVGNQVTLTVTDVNGLSSTCTANVTVLDNLPPTAQCTTATVFLDATGNGTLTAAMVNNGSTDNCGIASMSVSPSSFNCSNIGSNTVVLTVTDPSGHTATCTTSVTVVDNIQPIALCQNVTVTLDPSGNGSVTSAQVNNGSSDACGIASMTVNPNTFNCSNISGIPTPTDLFISEYIEGTSNNKCIEIFNGTGSPVNLTAGGYQLRFYFNGASSSGLTINLTGTLAANDVYVVCNSGAAPSFLAQADLTNGSGWYNGDDAVVLVKNSGTTTLDIVGRIGEDPGTAWGIIPLTTIDQSLRRNNTVTSGVSVNPGSGFPTLATEWTSFGTNDDTGLGSHVLAAGSGSGTVPVVLTVNDFNGNSASCNAVVTVVDNTPPNVLCQSITVALNAAGNASITAAQINNGSTDACGINNISVSPSSFTCANLGPNAVTLTVTDVNGNSASCLATVTVIDNTPPAINCQNVTVVLDPSGNGILTAAQVNNGSTDNCSINTIGISQTAFSCTDVGSGTIPTDLFISEYIEGSSFNKCIEIYNGTGSPVDLGANGYQLRIYFNGALSSTNINLTGVIAPGQVHVVCHTSAGAAFTAQADQLSGSVNFNGNDAVTLYNGTLNAEIDIFGRIGENPGTAWVGSTNQTLDRTLTRKPSVLQGVGTNPASGFPTLDSEWNQFAIDNSSSLGSHSITIGSNVVTLTVTDFSGNSSSCNATVTVVDNTPPAVSCQPLTVQLGPGGTVSISASQLDNGSTDACGGLIFSASQTTFDCSDIGSNVVLLTVTDANGNAAICTTSVTVQDVIPPVISCPSDIITTNGAGICGAIVNYSLPTGTDVCNPNTIQTSGLASGSVFPVGTTVNTFTVTDGGGNTSTCSFSVIVTDNEPPSIVNCPTNFSSCNPVTWTPPVITDNCPGVQISSNYLPGSSFGPGSTLVTYTANDVYNNANTCSFTVTRLEESTAPTSLTTDRDYNNVCLGESAIITINGGSLGEAATWKWYSGTCGGAALPAFNGMTSITVTPSATTTYFARAEGTCNTTTCASVTVVVSTSPPGNVTITSMPPVAAPGSSGVITCTNVPTATFYRWTSVLGHINAVWFNGSPGPVQTTIPSVNVSFQLPLQNYQIRLVAGNACGRSSNANAHIRGSVEAPSCLNGPTQACPGNTLNYNVNSCLVAGANGYSWTVTPAVAGTATIVSGQGTASINISYSAGFTTAQVCVSGVSQFNLPGPPTCITVSSTADTPGLISGNPAPCVSSTGNYTIAPVNNASGYVWSTTILGATVSGTGTTGTVIFPAGSFSGNVCVRAQTPCGLSAQTCLSITSGAAGVPGPITGTETGVCGASNVNYSLATNDANSYNWILPSNVFVSGGGPTNLNSINVDFIGVFSVNRIITVEAFYNCGSATSSITVSGKPSAPIVTPNQICPGDDELYFASSTGSGLTYIWNSTGADFEECTNPSCSQYYVVWNASAGSLDVHAHNTCGNSPTTSVSNTCRVMNPESETRVFPNPTNGQLTVEFNGFAGGKYNIIITDMTGRVMMHEDLTARSGINQLEMDLGFANAGLYMVYLKDTNGNIAVMKVTVE